MQKAKSTAMSDQKNLTYELDTRRLGNYWNATVIQWKSQLY